MVRTLDFHSNNVGSIPASLIMQHVNFHAHKHTQRLLTQHLSRPTNVRYSLVFKSLIALGTVRNLRLLLNFKPQSNKSKKLLVKQSYMLFTWLFYIENNLTKCKTNVLPKFFIRPSRQKFFTQTKAPMAHKTFSQEQFFIKTYSLQITFTSQHPQGALILNDANKSLLAASLIRTSMPFFDTNLFFLKKITFNLKSSDYKYLLLL